MHVWKRFVLPGRRPLVIGLPCYFVLVPPIEGHVGALSRIPPLSSKYRGIVTVAVEHRGIAVF